MTPSDEFPVTLDQTAEAVQSLVTGNAKPFLALWSRREDVTVMGGFGGYLRGWDHVRQNTELAASRFRGGHISVERVASGTSGELAYAVWLERGDVYVTDGAEAVPLVVRVTQIFRREDDAWKLIHRHGDQVADKS